MSPDNRKPFILEENFKLDVTSLTQVLDTIPDLIFIKDRQHRFLFINKSLENFFGFSSEQMIGKTDHDFFSQEQANISWDSDEKVFLEKKSSVSEEKLTNFKGKTSILETKKNIFETTNGEMILVGITRDITELRNAQSSLENSNKSLFDKAHADSLTGLPNRRCLDGYMRSAMTEYEETKAPFAILFIDLDKFKAINDTFGHSIGDELLIIVSQRIKQAIRKDDYLVRIGGDEFIVIIKVSTEKSLLRIVNSIKETFTHTIVIKENHINIDISIGIATYPQNGSTMEELLNNADKNMYIHKQSRQQQQINFGQSTRYKSH
ncbi:MAG: diguanylate cyclase [Nitrosomonas sp.]|nr:diguanylate cyclase [Nitrosomonas sp.]